MLHIQIYAILELELVTLHEYIQENAAKGFICCIIFPARAPVLFVKQKDGSLNQEEIWD